MAAISSAPRRYVAPISKRRIRARAWRILLALALIGCDTVAVNASFIGMYFWHLPEITASGFLLPNDPRSIWAFLLLFNLAFGFSFVASGLYDLRRGASRIDEAYKVFTAISLTTILAFLMNTILTQSNYATIPWTTSIIASGWLVAIVSTITLRFLHRHLVFWLRTHDIDTRRVLIVGAHTPGRAVWHTIRRAPELGYRVQGFLSDTQTVGSLVEGVPVLGRIAHLDRVVRATRADEVLIALSGRTQEELLHVVALIQDESVAIKVYPDTFHLITNNEVSIGDLSGLPLVSVKNAALDNPWNQTLKRTLDIVVASLVLLVTSPLMLAIAVLIKLDSHGPTFFLQERVGLDGKPFWMLKFRTMRIDSEATGPGWTKPGDPRVTRLGALLRRYSLDELPQFINVLRGDMSVVGPRPEQPRWVHLFSQQIPRYMRRHKEKAGITGWAQVNGLRGDTSIEERTRYDLYYIENWSLLFDLKIIMKTMVSFITGRQENAY